MLRARAVRAQRRGVLGRDVALVPREVVLRPGAVELAHDPVPRHLGHHRRRRDAGRDPVALPDGEGRRGQPGDREAVGEHVGRARVEPQHRLAHGPHVHDVQPAAVDLGRRDDDHRPRQRPPQHLVVGLLARGLGQQLGVGEPGHLAAAALRQDHGGDDERTGAGAATGLVGAGDVREAAALQHPLEGPQAVLGPDDRPGGAHVTHQPVEHLEELLGVDVLARCCAARRGSTSGAEHGDHLESLWAVGRGVEGAVRSRK